jgi:hypothetical protein
VAVSPSARPIRLVVRDDDLHRSRLTVFFRLILVIPHLVWLVLWGFAVSLVALMLWVAVTVGAHVPPAFHEFVAGWIRYATHLSAYLSLAASPYPSFGGTSGYPIDLEIEPPSRQSRWSAAFRLVLALPALALATALGAVLAWGPLAGVYLFILVFLPLFLGGGVLTVAAVLAWFASLVRGRCPVGLRDLAVYALGYAAETAGYALWLTGRYPSSDPALAEPLPELPEHPVRIVVDDELRRSRLTVFFRLLLAIPHFIWITLWAIAVVLAAFLAWILALAVGHLPSWLHRFIAAYVRYATHLYAFVYIVGSKFPGFTGREGSYGIDLRIDGPQRQNRWKTLFRLVLAVPALLVGGALGTVLFVVAVLAWWYALITGRMPEGLRNLGASCLRYSAQTSAYLFLLTDRYPYASPVLRGRPSLVQRAPELPPEPALGAVT